MRPFVRKMCRRTTRGEPDDDDFFFGHAKFLQFALRVGRGDEIEIRALVHPEIVRFKIRDADDERDR